MPTASVEFTAARCLTQGMRHIAGGSFFMSSDKHYPEEWPANHARVSACWMDKTAVTNDQFSPLRRRNWICDCGRAGRSAALGIPVLSRCQDAERSWSRRLSKLLFVKYHSRCIGCDAQTPRRLSENTGVAMTSIRISQDV
jgi:hypothetical protein